MTIDDGDSLRLGELADVDSPEIVRNALRRFRRRTLVRALWIAAAVAAAMWVLPRINAPSSYLPQRYAAAPDGHVVGAVVRSGPAEAIIIDAKRLDAETPVLHAIVKVDGLKVGETLGIEAGGVANVAPGYTGPPPVRPPLPPAQARIGPDTSAAARPGTPVRETWIELDPGVSKLTIRLSALTERFGSENKAPGAHTQDECAEPLNPNGVCELLKIEGRRLGTIELDLVALGIPRSIWR